MSEPLEVIEEVEVAPKVISIRTRKAWVPPEGFVEEELPEPVVDEGSKEAAHIIGEGVKCGDITGLVALTWCEDAQSFDLWINLPPAEHVNAAALRYLGGLKLIEDVLMDIVAEANGDMLEMDE